MPPIRRASWRHSLSSSFPPRRQAAHISSAPLTHSLPPFLTPARDGPVHVRAPSSSSPLVHIESLRATDSLKEGLERATHPKTAVSLNSRLPLWVGLFQVRRDHVVKQGGVQNHVEDLRVFY